MKFVKRVLFTLLLLSPLGVSAIELLDPASLADRLGRAEIILIDAESPQDYQRAHIPGAVNLHFLELEDEDENLKTGLPIFAQLAASKFGAIGVNEHSEVVIYDRGDGRAASAVWYILRFLGHQQVSILDGGFRQWLAQGRLVTQQPPEAETAIYKPEPNPNFALLTTDLHQPNRLLVDARSIAEYSGKEDGGARRAGHIPGAISFPWDRLADGETTFRDEAAMRQALQQAGITPDREIVTYCNGGLGRSTFLFAALQKLGYPNVTVYPGSWVEWASDPSRPIER